MRRTAIIAVLLSLLPTAAWGGQEPLSDTRARRDAAWAEARALAARVDQLSERYRRAEARAEQASAMLVDAHRADQEAVRRVEGARGILAERASVAYRVGPGGFVTVLLGANSLSDLFTIREILQRAFAGDVDRIAAALDDRAETLQAGRAVERWKRRLVAQQRRLAAMRAELEEALVRARRAAEEADLEVAELEARARELAEAERRAQERTRVVRSLDEDLATLLARLGPNGGRGCAIPDTLERTGETFEGISSWYGWDFAGRPTASGAIYDPRLFTAAHRTLPLNSYLLVRRGDRCAKVLVNDRGPFIEGRVLDLSKGAADYLGVSLTHVEAEILVPTD
jgi:rare lipoprotein A (peptidoglycan hydrolase)